MKVENFDKMIWKKTGIKVFFKKKEINEELAVHRNGRAGGGNVIMCKYANVKM